MLDKEADFGKRSKMVLGWSWNCCSKPKQMSAHDKALQGIVVDDHKTVTVVLLNERELVGVASHPCRNLMMKVLLRS